MFVGHFQHHDPNGSPDATRDIGRRWLTENSADADILIAVGAREEAIATIQYAGKNKTPIVLVPLTEGPENDSYAWGQGASAKRYLNAISKADRIVVADPSAGRMLVSQGVLPEKVVSIPPAIRSPTILPSTVSSSEAQTSGAAHAWGNTAEFRSQARQSLAAVNLDLATQNDSPVILCDAAMVRGGPIDLLAQIAMPLIASYPDARLWIIGDGPGRGRLYDRLRGDGLRQSIAMPGSFVDWDDLMMAADVFLHLNPSPEIGALTEAIAYRKVIAVADTMANRSWFAKASACDHVGWFDTEPASLLKTIRGLLANLPSAATRADVCARDMTRCYPKETQLSLWQQELDRLIQRVKVPAARSNGPNCAIEIPTTHGASSCESR